MYLDLLPEVQEIVVKYLIGVDMKNLSLTCRHLCNTLRPILFRKVRIECDNLLLNENVVNFLQEYTRTLIVDIFESSLLERVNSFNSVEILYLFCSDTISDEEFGMICGKLPRLTELCIQDQMEAWGDSFFMHLTKLTSLEKFSIEHYYGAIRLVFKYLGQIESLKEISVCYCQLVPGIALHHLAPLRNLEVLAICESYFDISEGFKSLANMSKLRKLDLSHNETLRTGSALGLLTSLEELILDGCEIDERTFLSICTLPKLKKLDLSHCYIDIDNHEEVWQHLSSLTTLEELVCFDCPLTDDLLLTIASLPTLKKLDVRNTFYEDEVQKVLQGVLSCKEIEIKAGVDDTFLCNFYCSIGG